MTGFEAGASEGLVSLASGLTTALVPDAFGLASAALTSALASLVFDAASFSAAALTALAAFSASSFFLASYSSKSLYYLRFSDFSWTNCSLRFCVLALASAVRALINSICYWIGSTAAGEVADDVTFLTCSTCGATGGVIGVAFFSRGLVIGVATFPEGKMGFFAVSVFFTSTSTWPKLNSGFAGAATLDA